VALIPTYSPTVAGTPPSMVQAASGDTCDCGEPNRPNILIVENTGAQMTVTIATPGTLPSGDAYPDKVYTVPATTGRQWIPLLPDYKDPATGFAALTYSSTSGVTRVVLRP
jgi:hypothetical protein